MTWPLEAEDSLGFFSFLSSKPTKWVKSVPSEWAVSHNAHARRGLGRPQNDLRSPFSKLKAEAWKLEKVPPPINLSTHLCPWALTDFPALPCGINRSVYIWVPTFPRVPPHRICNGNGLLLTLHHGRQLFHGVEILAALGSIQMWGDRMQKT